MLTKPNSWPMLLRENTNVAIRQMAKVKPYVFEGNQETRKLLLSRYDSLKRSLQFFMYGDKKKGIFYSKPDRAVCIMNILAEMDEIKIRGSEIPEAKTIGQLCQIDEAECEDNIVLILNDLRLFFQVDNMISTDGLYSVCSIIISEYPSLTLEELAICMNQAKIGHFGKDGKVYNRLDGAIILSWIKQYFAEKQTRIGDRNYTYEAHAKIGLDEGRGVYMNNSTLLLQAQIVIAGEKIKKGNKK
jgi:hypothetical protein